MDICLFYSENWGVQNKILKEESASTEISTRKQKSGPQVKGSRGFFGTSEKSDW